MPNAQAVYAEFFEQEFNAVLGVAKSIEPSNYMKQLKEGKAHPMWLLGHLANTNNVLINMWCCEGESLLPSEWRLMFSPDFAGGTPPSSDADFYPSWDEVLEVYTTISKACVSGIKGISDEVLEGPLIGNVPDMIREHFKTIDNALRTVTLHSAYHRGQMALINLQD